MRFDTARDAPKIGAYDIEPSSICCIRRGDVPWGLNLSLEFRVIVSKTKFFTRESNPIHVTFVTHRNAPSDGFIFLWGPDKPYAFDWNAALKRIGFGDTSSLRMPFVETRMVLPAKEGRFRIDNVVGKRMYLMDALRFLSTAKFSKNRRHAPCPSMLAWSYASKFALELIARQSFTPNLRTYAHDLFAAWQVTIESTLDIGRLKQLAACMPPCAYALYCKPHNKALANPGKYRRQTMIWHPEALLRAYLDASVDAFMRATFSIDKFSGIACNIQGILDALPNASSPRTLEESLRLCDSNLDRLKSYAARMVELTIHANAEKQESQSDEETVETAEPEDETFDGEEDAESLEEEEAQNEEEDKVESEGVHDVHDEGERDDHEVSLNRSATPKKKKIYTEEEISNLYQNELRHLMPMKEYVYTVPKEFDAMKVWEVRWFRSLLAPKRESTIDYHLEDPDLVEMLKKWLSPLHENAETEELDARTGFWLEAPTPDSMGYWFLKYVLEAIEDPTIVVPAEVVFSVGSEHLRMNQHSFENPQERLLTDLGIAAQYFEPLKRSLEQTKPEGVFLDTQQVWKFISEVSPELTAAGFDVRLPEELSAQGNRRLRARFKISDAIPDDVDRRAFGLNDLAGFQWEAALGDDVINVEEFREIVALKLPLVQWKGSWVLVDPDQLHDIETIINNNDAHGTLTRFDAMNRALSGVADPNHPDSNVEVVVEGKLSDVLNRLTQEDIADMTLKAPDTFVGKLRPYQERGVAWLSYQQRLGLGCCLADDMGLGKTVQLICHVLNQIKRHPEDCRGTLLICPMSVVGNWKREFERFAPSVHVVVHHGNSRAQSRCELERQLEIPGTVIITTYGLMMRATFLVEHTWNMVVLDEAQAIKNATTKRSTMIRSVQADFRVALTGTPIENRLSELWSILDFLNPGLLGTHAKFQRLYGNPIEKNNDTTVMERLRNLVSPFIMRRVKTDPKIIQDLPEKMENKVYCTLTREQATLYQALVESTMGKIEHAKGITRHGQVLALLTHLKQIVDHPMLYQKSSKSSGDRSGKVQRLIEMLETIIENGERALVFTQFKEMGDALVEFLKQSFGFDTVPFLHGGLSASQRDALVADFQAGKGAPVFILSLKAGGTGLNLTAASHVFHFDRWWNPAVEDQATDRAFRIGQEKNVQVHKFLTLGTLEEKIDAMLEEKKSLSDAIVDASGAWITQFDTDGLRELFTLSSDAMIDEAE